MQKYNIHVGNVYIILNRIVDSVNIKFESQNTSTFKTYFVAYFFITGAGITPTLQQYFSARESVFALILPCPEYWKFHSTLIRKVLLPFLDEI